MNNESVFGIMDIIVLICGIYVLYCYYLLVFRNEMKEGLLLPKGVDPKKCRDIEGFKNYMGFRTLIFGMVAVIDGGIGIYSDYVSTVSMPFYMGAMVILFAVLIWFAISTKKAEKMYF